MEAQSLLHNHTEAGNGIDLTSLLEAQQPEDDIFLAELLDCQGVSAVDVWYCALLKVSYFP